MTLSFRPQVEGLSNGRTTFLKMWAEQFDWIALKVNEGDRCAHPGARAECGMNNMSKDGTSLLLAILCGLSASSSALSQGIRRMKPGDFCVTEGHLGATSSEALVIEDTKTRAVLGRETRAEAEIAFRYLGPTREQSALGSGTVRTQVGLKLRAQDGCNLVYVMWRILPESRVVVSIKSNPGQRTYAECANRGYHNIKGIRSNQAPTIEPGSSHSLWAELERDRLVVKADGRIVWDGQLDATAFAFDGPVGFRTDNGRFEIEFRAAPTSDRFACSERMGPE
jgi:hypothetical protein